MFSPVSQWSRSSTLRNGHHRPYIDISMLSYSIFVSNIKPVTIQHSLSRLQPEGSTIAMARTHQILLFLSFIFVFLSVKVVGQVFCDSTATSPDDTWRSRMHAEITDGKSAVSQMINGMCSLKHPFWDCNANGNTPNHCKYTVK